MGNFTPVLAYATKQGAMLHRTLNLPPANTGSVRQVEENSLSRNYVQAKDSAADGKMCAHQQNMYLPVVSIAAAS
jgi:uncharacterized membrane protein